MSSFNWVETGTDQLYWLTIGPYTVELIRPKFGNAKTLQRRQIIRRDLPMLQSTWPRARKLQITFVSQLHTNDCSPEGYVFPVQRLLAYLRDYPGYGVTLKSPESVNPVQQLSGVEYRGVITNHNYSEYREDKYDVDIELELTKEFHPDGEMVIL